MVYPLWCVEDCRLGSELLMYVNTDIQLMKRTAMKSEY